MDKVTNHLSFLRSRVGPEQGNYLAFFRLLCIFLLELEIKSRVPRFWRSPFSRENSPCFAFLFHPPPPTPPHTHFSSFSRENSVSLCRGFSSLSPFCLLNSSVMFRFPRVSISFLSERRTKSPRVGSQTDINTFRTHSSCLSPRWDHMYRLTHCWRSLQARPQSGLTLELHIVDVISMPVPKAA